MKYIYILIAGFLALFLVSCDTIIEKKRASLDINRLEKLDEIIEVAIANADMHGAVVTVVQDDGIKYLKAYGHKQILPTKLPMTENTIFDLASLTKPIATASSAMKLIEDGKLRLNDNVSYFLKDFRTWVDTVDIAKEKEIKIVHLLTHSSGLPSYVSPQKLAEIYVSVNKASLIDYINTVEREFEPASQFNYSCLNFIILQQIIEKIAKEDLKQFLTKNIFDPLGMKHTSYNPSKKLFPMIAPTELQADSTTVLQGIVHDPLAQVLGGISGNAGLFSTAEDLAKMVQMLLNEGEFKSKRILSPASIKIMTSVPHGYESLGRALGWDVYSPYDNDGDLFSINTYGHTGYTGTSISIDPDSKTAVILLTNRVHPYDQGSLIRLRHLVANLVASSMNN